MTTRLPRQGRIYPVPVKPRTQIDRWGDWPKDCVDAIRKMVRGWYSTGGVFKCCDCGEFCEPHPYGVPHLGGPGWKGHAGWPAIREAKNREAEVLCDDCLIVRARNG